MKTKIVSFQSLKCCIRPTRLQPVAAWFLQSCWLVTHIRTAVRLPKSCSQWGSALRCWAYPAYAASLLCDATSLPPTATKCTAALRPALRVFAYSLWRTRKC